MGKRMLAGLVGVVLLTSPALADALADDVALDALAESVTVTPAQAVKAAKARERGRVKEICLKAYEGRPVYEVEFENDRDVLIDARSGRVIEGRRRTR